MINSDIVGVGKGNSFGLYNSLGASHEVSYIAKRVADELGYMNDTIAQDLHSTSSDHATFEAVGVYVKFLTYRMSLDSYYHKKADTIETISPQFLYNTTDVVVNTVLEMQNEGPRKAVPTSIANYNVDMLETEDFTTR